MSKLASLACTILAAGTLAATLPDAAQAQATIGLAVANLQADFFNQIKQSVSAEAKARGVQLVVVDAHGDSATQVNQSPGSDHPRRQGDHLYPGGCHPPPACRCARRRRRISR